MKRYITILLSVLLLASITTAFAIPAAADTENGTLEDGLVLWYDFSVYNENNETFKNLADDTYGDIEYIIGNPSAIMRDSGALGKTDSALYFDGSTGLYSDDVTLTSMNQVSISVWIKPDYFPGNTNATPNIYLLASTVWDVGSMQCMFVWGDVSGTCQVPIKGNSKLTTGGAVNDQVNYYTYYRSPILTVSEWTLMTYVYDAESKTISSYQNGELLETAVYGDSTVGVNFYDFWLGCYPNASSYANYKGWLEDFRMYDRVLTADEVKALYNGDGRNITADLTSFYSASTETTAPEITPVPNTTVSPETSSTPETTTAALVTTAAPDTTATEENTASAEETTTVAVTDEKGCGSAFMSTAAILTISILGAALSIGKKKHK